MYPVFHFLEISSACCIFFSLNRPQNKLDWKCFTKEPYNLHNKRYDLSYIHKQEWLDWCLCKACHRACQVCGTVLTSSKAWNISAFIFFSVFKQKFQYFFLVKISLKIEADHTKDEYLSLASCNYSGNSEMAYGDTETYSHNPLIFLRGLGVGLIPFIKKLCWLIPYHLLEKIFHICPPLFFHFST